MLEFHESCFESGSEMIVVVVIQRQKKIDAPDEDVVGVGDVILYKLLVVSSRECCWR